jgi:hypothetical protein
MSLCNYYYKKFLMTKTIANGLKKIKHFIVHDYSTQRKMKTKIIYGKLLKITLKEAWLRAARRKAAVV